MAQWHTTLFAITCLELSHPYEQYKETLQRNIAAEYSTFQEGKFRFNELLEHLKCYNAYKVVSLGEDSTCVISGVHYETNKLVGLVLPCNDNGLHICDSFLATSFKAMETSFQEGSVTK